MNSNADIAEAFKRATEDKELKLVHFMQTVTMDIAFKKCPDCAAPGFGESQTPGTKRQAAEISDKGAGELSKAQRKRQLNKERRESEKEKLNALVLQAKDGGGKFKAQKRREAKRQRAIQNGGVGDGSKGGGKGGGKGKDKGKKTKTADGKNICFKWSKGVCDPSPRQLAHVC